MIKNSQLKALAVLLVFCMVFSFSAAPAAAAVEAHYSGNAFARVLHVVAVPDLLLDLSAGKSYSWIDTAESPFARSKAIPLEIEGILEADLLTVESSGDQGTVTGELLATDLPPLLTAGLLSGTAHADLTPQANSNSTVAYLQIGLPVISSELEEIVSILSGLPLIGDLAGELLGSQEDLLGLVTGLLQGNLLETSLLESETSAKPTNSTAKVDPVDISLLENILEIKALQVDAFATATGVEGGADASFNWSVADITLLGSSIKADLLAEGVVELPGILRISLGSSEIDVKEDGTYASVSGSALVIEVLDLSALLELELSLLGIDVSDINGLLDDLIQDGEITVAVGEVEAVSTTHIPDPDVVPEAEEEEEVEPELPSVVLEEEEKEKLPRTSATDLLMLGLGASMLSGGWVLRRKTKK